jgi:hypothetical protein
MDETKRWFAAKLGFENPDDLPLTLTIEQAGRPVGMNKQAAYRAAAAGDMPVIEFGGRKRVPTVAWLRIVAGEVSKAA